MSWMYYRPRIYGNVQTMSQDCKLSPIPGFSLYSGCYGLLNGGKGAEKDSFVARVDLYFPFSLILVFINSLMAGFVVFVDSLVSGLLSRCRPFAIRWLIVSVVVDSIKTMIAGSSKAHIGKEIRETVYPSSADCYSAPTVTVISVAAFVEAALFHFLPGRVFWRSVHSMPFIHGVTVPCLCGVAYYS